MPERFTTLALYRHGSRSADDVGAAARAVGLTVVELPADPADLDVLPSATTAWRCPPGLAVHMAGRGTPLPVTGASASWFAGLPTDLTGRRLQVVTARDLRAGAGPEVAMVKLAELKDRHFPATRVRDVGQARTAVADLPAGTRLLVADRWLECHSEYRVFCAGDRALTCSPYRIEDELWSPLLRTHRASFHDEAAAFVQQVLTGLPAADRPPACVLDVARLDDGRLVLLEVNTAWGSGLYGCDPQSALVCVLAANAPAGDEWAWPPP